MKKIMCKMLCIMMSLAVAVPVNLQVANAFFGWVGAGGSNYVASLARQPGDINVSANNGKPASSKYSLALDAGGNPHIVWEDGETGNIEVLYVKWGGNGWVNAAGQPFPENPANVSANKGQSRYPCLALDQSGNPHIAWDDDTTENNEIFYVRWSGSSWVNAAGQAYPANSANVSQNDGFSEFTSLKIDASGRPHIAWDDDTTENNEIFYVRWDGKSWVNAVGQSYPANSANVSQNDGFSENASLALDSKGFPRIAWDDDVFGTQEVLFVQWTGKAWATAAGQPYPANVANVSQNEGLSEYPCLALDQAGNPHLAWDDNTPGDTEIYYVKWEGAHWVNVTGSSYPSNSANVSKNDGFSEKPSLALDSSSRPHIAWDDSETGIQEVLYVKWSGGAWVSATNQKYPQNPGNINFMAKHESFSPSLALDSGDGAHIAWTTESDPEAPTPLAALIGTSAGKQHKIYYARFMAKFEGGFKLAKSVDTNNDGIFDNDTATVKAGDTLEYKINWSYDDKAGDPLQNACVYSLVPKGTKYVPGALPPIGLWHSLNEGKTWEYGEPMAGSVSGTLLKWEVPTWLGAAGSPLTNASPFAHDIGVTSGTFKNISSKYSLAIDSKGFPHLAWSDDAMGNEEILYVKWNGKEWVNASGQSFQNNSSNVSQNTGKSTFPTLVLDTSDNAHIAWSDGTSGNDEICYVKWDGKAWVSASGGAYPVSPAAISSTEGDSKMPTLALDKSVRPHIAWSDASTENDEIIYIKWSGSSWVNVKGEDYPAKSANVSQTKGSSGYPTLALDAEGKPNLTWHDNTLGDYEVYYVKWNGVSWVNASGQPYPENTANVSQSKGSSEYPTLALDAGGNPHIAWHDSMYGEYEIVYVKWNESSWVNAFGHPYPENPGNISQNPGLSEYVSLALDGKGNPHLSWDDDTLGNAEIMYVKWNGHGWVNDCGQAYPEAWANVSGSDSDAFLPSLAVDKSGFPHLAWGNIEQDNYQVLYARHVPNEFEFRYAVKVDSPLKKENDPICTQAMFMHDFSKGMPTYSNRVCNPVK